jgi:anhydro-N-acetylmuramic acid kinase
MPAPEYYIGLMSGTSLDGIDAVIVDLSENPVRMIASQSTAFPKALRKDLLSLCTPDGNEIHRTMQADRQLGKLYALCVKKLLGKVELSSSDIVAIGCHGQTIRHSPGTNPAYTLQIGDPNTLAELTGITTVADFRRRDIAAGGEAAPLVPAFHQALFQNDKEDRVIINIGGIANITLLSANNSRPVTGFDTGPGNVLMDSWIQLHQKQPYDKNGKWASSGTVHDVLLTSLLKDKYFKRRPPKSTGREYFNIDWLKQYLNQSGKRIQRKHVQATLCELTAQTIADAINKHAPNTQLALVCGGGVHNLALMFRLQALLDNCQIRSTEDYDVDPDWVEAMCFAWLAKRTLEGKPGNLASVTNARHSAILGGIYRA